MNKTYLYSRMMACYCGNWKEQKGYTDIDPNCVNQVKSILQGLTVCILEMRDTFTYEYTIQCLVSPAEAAIIFTNANCAKAYRGDFTAFCTQFPPPL